MHRNTLNYVTINQWSFVQGQGDGMTPPFGTTPLALRGIVKIEGSEIRWIPDDQTVVFLRTATEHRFGQRRRGANPTTLPRPIKPVTAWLDVLGNFIWRLDQNRRIYLNGAGLGTGNPTDFALSLTDREPLRGGALKLWFFLTF